MKTNYIINHAEDYVKSLYESEGNLDRVYHNYDHAYDVYQTAVKLAAKSNLNSAQLEVLSLAALFHDTGYLKSMQNHEQLSSEIAKSFLSENSYPPERTESVISAIVSTQLPQNPKDIVEELLCDADLSHLGRKSYIEKAAKLRGEIELLCNKSYSDIDWFQSSIDFFTRHKYFTQVAALKYNDKKVKTFCCYKN